MQILVGILFVLVPVLGYASCGEQAAILDSQKAWIYIDCDEHDVPMINFALKENGKRGEQKSVPFLSECSLTKTGFKCHANGITPLAGATFEKIMFGRSNNSCAEPEELGAKFVCVKGCTNPKLPHDQQIIPEYLEADGGSC